MSLSYTPIARAGALLLPGFTLACSVTVPLGFAQAADLPARKAAPVQYVKICDAYGSGFFYIPGTETCLKVGGTVMADVAASNTPFRFNLPNQNVAGAVVSTTVASVAKFGGAIPLSSYINGASRDALAWNVQGRIDLDARTSSPWGTVRSFIRITSLFGSGATANTGALSNSIIGQPTYLGTNAARETTVLDKAFIQFAGISAGRIQSFFDFYADKIGYTNIHGSNQTVAALAYTASLGGGFSASFSIEDSFSHRGAAGNTVTFGNNFVNGAPISQFMGTRWPDFVANLRLDQGWGAVQLSGALHQNRAALWAGTVAFTGGSPPPSTSLARTQRMGFAVQGGVQFKLNSLAPGDELWLQATYAKGAIGYVSGTDYNYTQGVGTSTNYGAGLGRVSSGNGFTGAVDADCIWTYSGDCEQSSSYAVVAAFRHYWTPTISSTLTGSYWQVNYTNNALNPMNGAATVNTGAIPFGLGVSNYKEYIVATGLAWNPVKNFEIGSEFAWYRPVTSRPVGLAPDAVLKANGLPAFRANSDLFRGRIRLLRAF